MTDLYHSAFGLRRAVLAACVALALLLPSVAPGEELKAFAEAITADESFEWRNQSDTGVVLILTVTGVGTGTLTPTVQIERGLVDVGGQWEDLSEFTAITATGLYIYFLGAGMPATAPGEVTEVQQLPLPQAQLRVLLDKSDSSSWSMGASWFFLE